MVSYVEVNKHTGERRVMMEAECAQRVWEIYKHMGYVEHVKQAQRVMGELRVGKEWEGTHQWIRQFEC